MTEALTPAQALEYLRTLSADIEEAAVLAADGSLLAGPDHLAEPARALLAAAPEAGDVEVSTAAGCVFAARSTEHAVVLVSGRFALPALVRLRPADGARRPRRRAPGRRVRRPRTRGPVGAVSASLARRRALREPRVVVRESARRTAHAGADDPVAERLQEAAEALISAAQRGSGG